MSWHGRLECNISFTVDFALLVLNLNRGIILFDVLYSIFYVAQAIAIGIIG